MKRQRLENKNDRAQPWAMHRDVMDIATLSGSTVQTAALMVVSEHEYSGSIVVICSRADLFLYPGRSGFAWMSLKTSNSNS